MGSDLYSADWSLDNKQDGCWDQGLQPLQLRELGAILFYISKTVSISYLLSGPISGPISLIGQISIFGPVLIKQ